MLDKVDQGIIDCLVEDGRMSYVDIGKRLNISRVSVRDRVQQLKEKGIIERFSVVVNSEKTGKTVFCFF